mmetsp:Transcript_73505/g.212903  ORF Transcript_73505/g.212903 Transcript_73505/m.212903 type:complete len:200 (-) Transcript_73505:73-672(-)
MEQPRDLRVYVVVQSPTPPGQVPAVDDAGHLVGPALPADEKRRLEEPHAPVLAPWDHRLLGQSAESHAVVRRALGAAPLHRAIAPSLHHVAQRKVLWEGPGLDEARLAIAGNSASTTTCESCGALRVGGKHECAQPRGHIDKHALIAGRWRRLLLLGFLRLARLFFFLLGLLRASVRCLRVRIGRVSARGAITSCAAWW